VTGSARARAHHGRESPTAADETVEWRDDVEHWMARFRCTRAELKAAFDAVGPSARAIEIYVEGAKTGSGATLRRRRQT